MSLFRWLSVALATLATTGALNAQTAPFSAVGLTALFGQEAASEVNRSDAVLTFIAALLDPTNDSIQRAWAIIELAQDLSRTSTDELLQGLSRFNTGSETYLNGINMKGLAGSCAPADYVINAQFTPFGQINGQFQGIQAITGLTPAGTLTLTSGTKPVSKECCAEAGCCAAVSAAKTCPACQASQKVKEDIASLLTSLKHLQTQIAAIQSNQCPACTVGSTSTVKDDCCCVKAGQVQTQACPTGACGSAKLVTVMPVTSVTSLVCDQNSGFCQSAGAANTVMVAPTPFLTIQKLPGGNATYTFLDEFRGLVTAPMPGQICHPNTLVAASPPMFFANSYMPPPAPQAVPFGHPQPFAYPPMPSPEFAPGVPRGLPSPAQAYHDLESVRAAAMNQAIVASTSRVAPAQPATKHNVHLVTPHMEAHCERLTSAGNADLIILEGDVQLTCNRNGQCIRIQGQRVVVHLADGTFTVDSAPEMRVNAPVSRVGYVVKPGTYLQTIPYSEVVCPPGPASSAPRD